MVQVKNSDGRVQTSTMTNRAGTTWDGPLVVMTSKFSASASEIFAGAIQDYGAGHCRRRSSHPWQGLGANIDGFGPANATESNELRSIESHVCSSSICLMVKAHSSKASIADIVLPSVTAKMDISEGDLEYRAQARQRPGGAARESTAWFRANLLAVLRQRSADRVAN